MSRKEVVNKNNQENQRQLHKTFFIQLESQKEDLYSIYFSFLQIYTQKQQEQVYKKWMQFPQKNQAYILSIKKEETKKKITQLQEASSWQECKIKNLKWTEVQVESNIIRIIRYNNSSNSQLEILQENRFSEFVIIHNVGSDQYEIQKLNLQNAEKLQFQEQAHIESQNIPSIVDQQLIQNNQSLQNNSDQENNNYNLNLNQYQTKITQQEKLILNLQQENQQNGKIINDLNKQLIEAQSNFENNFEQQQEEQKQIMHNLKTELDKLKTTLNQEKLINQELKEKLEKKEKELNIEKSKNEVIEQENSKIYLENIRLHNENLNLINELNELTKEHDKDKNSLEKSEKKYKKKKEKYQKLKEKISQQEKDMNKEMEKSRNEIDYIKAECSKKEQIIKDKDIDIQKLEQKLQVSEQDRQKYKQKYNQLKVAKSTNDYIYEANVNKALNFDETPSNTNRDNFLQHRNYYKNIDSNANQSNYENQFEYGINHNTDYYLDSYKQSLNKLSVQEKYSMNKDLSSQADIATLQSSLKDSRISSKKDYNQDSFIMQTLEKQKNFVQNYQSNDKKNTILDCLNSYEKQLKFESQIFDSYSKIQSNSNLESSKNQDTISSVSQLSEDEQELNKSKLSASKSSCDANNINNDKSIKKQRKFKQKSKNSPNKHQKIIKQQDPSKLLNSKSHKQKYLQSKKQNEKLLNKQINSSLITKPHIKEKVQEQIEKKQYQGSRQKLSQVNENNNKFQNINNLSVRSLLLTNKNHIKKQITKQQ
ncbi:hypothetical protein TTHERM_00975360 (macronuclear) [Tetrahymena thermophila SB210]|uniref:Uncharacterized protein n=1 Tax=Tetrahymena thermophila (strain SB210) TaxID=312017 RepID=Q22WQ6_TETTS|nr:hypothetical protein TTHERM_00975360 [Tetrahymena thermophila SB210]EAR89736.2 hypothetical protein TTHERM_00975360 [Tetrahymena thermophila SB210]|eukprot:XP_001009981.2 hypothetical protein TTHERM_00975360 [Tetrahymena thermophila SB210]